MRLTSFWALDWFFAHFIDSAWENRFDPQRKKKLGRRSFRSVFDRAGVSARGSRLEVSVSRWGILFLCFGSIGFGSGILELQGSVFGFWLLDCPLGPGFAFGRFCAVDWFCSLDWFWFSDWCWSIRLVLVH